MTQSQPRVDTKLELELESESESETQKDMDGAETMSSPVSQVAGSSKTASTTSDSSSVSSAEGISDTQLETDKPVPVLIRTASDTSGTMNEHGRQD